MRAAVAVAAVLVSAAPAPARADDATGSITGTVAVKRPDGSAAVPIVVYVVGFTEAAPESVVEVQQHDKKFTPDLVVITAGQTVSFPNGDPFLHNVFSPTESRKFDLGSYKKGDTRTRKFPHAGVSDVFCNIHPEMSATILVLPNTKFTFAAADGSFSIGDVPAGSWTVFAYSRHATKPTSATVDVTTGGAATVALTLDETARDFTHKNKYGEKYRGDGEYRPTK